MSLRVGRNAAKSKPLVEGASESGLLRKGPGGGIAPAKIITAGRTQDTPTPSPPSHRAGSLASRGRRAKTPAVIVQQTRLCNFSRLMYSRGTDSSRSAGTMAPVTSRR